MGLDCRSVTGFAGSWSSKANGTVLVELAKRRDTARHIVLDRAGCTGLKSLEAIMPV